MLTIEGKGKVEIERISQRFLNNYDSEWEVLNEENLYLDTFRKLQCLTNTSDTLLFLVNKNINTYTNNTSGENPYVIVFCIPYT